MHYKKLAQYMSTKRPVTLKVNNRQNIHKIQKHDQILSGIQGKYCSYTMFY